MSSKSPVRVEVTPPFLKALIRLKRKYPNVTDDLKTLTDQMERGETPGDQLQGIGYAVYKVRVRNTSGAKGKRGGYRVIYYLKAADLILLLAIYSKSEQADIATELLRRIIEENR